jgi:hypothetical protein
MARRCCRPAPTAAVTLDLQQSQCSACQQALWVAYHRHRCVTTLAGIVALTVRIRRCVNPACARYHLPSRPEEEGAWVLPQAEIGLDVIARVGALRYRQHQSVPEIHRLLQAHGLALAERTITNLLARYDELVALQHTNDPHLHDVLAKQGRVILALDGLQPDVGHEVLWVLRDCLSGEILLAQSLLSATEDDLVPLLMTVKERLDVPIVGVISDGQQSIRNAVATALPGVPHQLCQFHYLREAGRLIFEAGPKGHPHAKTQLKKCVRGIRPLERKLEGKTDLDSQATQGYCLAVRSALTDDGRPPLAAPGLKLADRLQAIAESLQRVAEKRGCLPTSPDSSER